MASPDQKPLKVTHDDVEAANQPQIVITSDDFNDETDLLKKIKVGETQPMTNPPIKEVDSDPTMLIQAWLKTMLGDILRGYSAFIVEDGEVIVVSNLGGFKSKPIKIESELNRDELAEAIMQRDEIKLKRLLLSIKNAVKTAIVDLEGRGSWPPNDEREKNQPGQSIMTKAGKWLEKARRRRQ